MTIDEFGRKIKQSHPEYGDMSDADVGSKMIQKYPQYKDMVDQPPTPQSNPVKTLASNAVESIPAAGGVLGGLGGGIAGAAAGGIGALPGSAIGVAGGTGAGLAVRDTLRPFVGSSEKASAREAVVEPLVAGATDLLTGGLMLGGGKVLSSIGKFATEKLPVKMMNQVFKETLPETRAALKKGEEKLGETLGEIALKKGEKGGAEAIWQQATAKIDDLENGLQQVLANAQESVPIQKIRDTIAPLIKRYRDAGNEADAVALEHRLENIVNSNGELIPLQKANEIKRTLYTEARNAYNKVSSETMEGIKAIARGLKEGIEEGAGPMKKTIQQINKDLSYHGRIADSMVDRIARVGRNEMLSLKNASLLAGGVAGAAPTGGASMLPFIGAMGMTTPGMTTMAQTLKSAPKIIDPLAQTAKKGIDFVRRLGTQAVANQ